VVQAIENWASVTGVVRGVVASDKGPGWLDLVLDVDPAQVQRVEGWPNLVREQVSDDHRLVVTCRAAELDEGVAQAGRQVTGWARLVAPGQVMAHRDGFSTLG
jgi:hypothetical protein